MMLACFRDFENGFLLFQQKGMPRQKGDDKKVTEKENQLNFKSQNNKAIAHQHSKSWIPLFPPAFGPGRLYCPLCMVMDMFLRSGDQRCYLLTGSRSKRVRGCYKWAAQDEIPAQALKPGEKVSLSCFIDLVFFLPLFFLFLWQKRQKTIRGTVIELFSFWVIYNALDFSDFFFDGPGHIGGLQQRWHQIFPLFQWAEPDVHSWLAFSACIIRLWRNHNAQFVRVE